MTKATTPMLLLVAVSAPVVWALGAADGWKASIASYDSVRQALEVGDLASSSRHATMMEADATRRERRFNPDRAGVRPEDRVEALHRIIRLRRAAQRLASADDLPSAKEAFHKLSVQMARWRDLVWAPDLPHVAFCPVVRKVWLQHDGPLTNPYRHEARACGRFSRGDEGEM